MSVTKYIESFSDLSETDYFLFPRNHYSMRVVIPLRNADAEIVGSDYGISLIGNAPAAKGIGSVSIRWIQVGTAEELDEARDNIVSKLHGFGSGYLHMSDGTKAKAKLKGDIPAIEVDWEQPHILPMIAEFSLYEDFA